MNTSPQRDQHNKTLQNICNIEWGLQMLKLYITVNTFPASNIRNQLFISKLDEAWPNHRSRHTQTLITFLLQIIMLTKNKFEMADAEFKKLISKFK